MHLSAPAGLTRAQAARLVLFWCALLALVIAVKLWPTARPLLSNDSFQYLSVAQNLRLGAGFRTSLVYFDEQRSWGVIPAPLTTWPVGYPTAIAAIQALGVPPELCGAIISAIATAVTLALLAVLGSKLGIPPFGQFLLLGLFALNFEPYHLTFAVGSDAPFTAVTLAAGAMLAFACERAFARGRWAAPAAGAGVLLGLAFWVRYAGLFVFVGVCASAVAFYVFRVRARVFQALVTTCSIAACGIGAGILRNVLLLGNWKGGNNEIATHSYRQIAHDFAVSVRDLLVGDAEPRHLLAVRLLMLGIVGLVGILAFAGYRTQRTANTPGNASTMNILLVLTIIVVGYVACFLYVERNTVITFDARFLYPMLPIALLVAISAAFSGGRLLAPGAGRLTWNSSWVALLGLYALIHLEAWSRDVPSDAIDAAEQTLESRTADGRSVRDLVLAATGPGDSIMSTDGQAIGYILHRPTVSLPRPIFTSYSWTEGFVRSTIRRFAVRVVLIGTAPADRAVSPFVAALAAGNSPTWLTKVGATERATVYRCADDL